METRREFLGASALSAAALSSAMAMRPGLAAPAGSAKKIRIGVVGGGFGAAFQWHNHPNCEVAAVTDLRADRRKRLRERYRCDNFYESLEVMLQRAKNLDAVAVFTGAPDHARHVEMCMRRGLHVVCAVPACLTLAEAERLKELKEKTGLRYMMAETSYYRQACIYARNLFRSGGFGAIFYSEVEYYHNQDLDKIVNDKTTMFYEPDGSRSWRWGYPPMLYPTHSTGFLVGVTGERIVRVSSLGWGTSHPHNDDNRYNNPFWNEAALMQTDRGHMVRCNMFKLVGAGGERAQWFGEKGSLYMRNRGLHPNTWAQRTGDPTDPPEPVEIPEYWKSDMLPEPMRLASGHGGSHVFISAEFINALLEDREPAIDLYESLAMTVPGIVAHESSLKNGEQMEVPQFDPSG